MLILNDLISENLYQTITNSQFPDSDWLQDGSVKYVVADNSDLATKVLAGNDFGFNYIEDGKGNLIDVEPISAPLEILKERKISEMSEICTQLIYNGTEVTLSSGEKEHFTLDEQDQSNLLGLSLSLNQGATQIPWHTDGEEECVYYSATDFMIIMGTLDIFKRYNTTYYRDLRRFIKTLSTVEEVNSIVYGYPLPEVIKSQVLIDLETQMGLR